MYLNYLSILKMVRDFAYSCASLTVFDKVGRSSNNDRDLATVSFSLGVCSLVYLVYTLLLSLITSYNEYSPGIDVLCLMRNSLFLKRLFLRL